MSCLLKLYIYICTICVCACVSGCRSCKTPKAELNANWIKIDKKTPKNKKILESHKKTWKTLSWLCFEDFVVNSAKIIPAILPKCLAGFSNPSMRIYFFSRSPCFRVPLSSAGVVFFGTFQAFPTSQSAASDVKGDSAKSKPLLRSCGRGHGWRLVASPMFQLHAGPRLRDYLLGSV